jgi:hypothetical protein
VFPATWWFILFRKHINYFVMKKQDKKVEAPQKPKRYNSKPLSFKMLKDGSLEFISTSKNPSSVPSWRKK